uniref:Acyl-CoA desaturase n=2 Tax=Lygus hesperus TaxID=30085 RepID=A0A0K8S5D1_LYGHE
MRILSHLTTLERDIRLDNNAPNGLNSSPVSEPSDHTFKDLGERPNDTSKSEEPFKPQWVWRNIILFIILHAGGLWGVWRFITFQVNLLTVMYAYIVGWITVEATMIGVHRFFSHKAFKGTFWFKLLVILTHTIAGQNSVYIWVRDHRLHHKYSETDADPHNSRRGFFFCHMGWLLQRKHPMVKLKGKNVDMSDLESEPLVMFQKKYYFLLFLILGVTLPVVPPVLLWHETG